MAFPWKVLAELRAQAGAAARRRQWRVNFSRVEWQHEIVDGKYSKVPKTKEDNWVWSPQGARQHAPPRTLGPCSICALSVCRFSELLTFVSSPGAWAKCIRRHASLPRQWLKPGVVIGVNRVPRSVSTCDLSKSRI